MARTLCGLAIEQREKPRPLTYKSVSKQYVILGEIFHLILITLGNIIFSKKKTWMPLLGGSLDANVFDIWYARHVILRPASKILIIKVFVFWLQNKIVQYQYGSCSTLSLNSFEGKQPWCILICLKFTDPSQIFTVSGITKIAKVQKKFTHSLHFRFRFSSLLKPEMLRWLYPTSFVPIIRRAPYVRHFALFLNWTQARFHYFVALLLSLAPFHDY